MVERLGLLTLNSDSRFISYYENNLQQVFFYITENCNARCQYCYYKPLLQPEYKAQEINPSVFYALAKHFYDLGATKMSLLGGEPSIYGAMTEGVNNVGQLVTMAKNIGYNYVRMVTNGLFDLSLLNDSGLQKIDEITFSVDGCTADIHEKERGQDTFVKVENAITNALKKGFKVQLTVCVHRGNIGYSGDGQLWLDEIIKWGEKIGVQCVNFHPFIKMNIPRDNWTGKSDILAKEWKSAYNIIAQNIKENKYKIDVRIPQRFIDVKTFQNRSNYYGYCPVKLAERVIVHANGNINVCALHNATNTTLSKYKQYGDVLKIEWSEFENELEYHNSNSYVVHSCPVISQKDNNDLPLCISFKPMQNEFVWNNMGTEDK